MLKILSSTDCSRVAAAAKIRIQNRNPKIKTEIRMHFPYVFTNDATAQVVAAFVSKNRNNPE